MRCVKRTQTVEVLFIDDWLAGQAAQQHRFPSLAINFGDLAAVDRSGKELPKCGPPPLMPVSGQDAACIEVIKQSLLYLPGEHPPRRLTDDLSLVFPDGNPVFLESESTGRTGRQT